MAYPNSYEAIEDVLLALHEGQWFGWLNPLDKSYENFIIHDNEAGRMFLASNIKPTKVFLETELVRLNESCMRDAIRSKRSKLIAETDFYALTDVTMSTAMTTYRQALRDITSQSGWPTTINWPTKP
jgi:hypothetical protein|tara:strand:+ start:463 stop:843 length:381 start_codon:yes stop_codon:yes gene_type:complete